MPQCLAHKKTWRDYLIYDLCSLPIDKLLSAVSVLVIAQPSSEVPDGLTNYPVCVCIYIYLCSLPIDKLLSAVSVLVIAQPSSEVPDGLMNYPVCVCIYIYISVFSTY